MLSLHIIDAISWESAHFSTYDQIQLLCLVWSCHCIVWYIFRHCLTFRSSCEYGEPDSLYWIHISATHMAHLFHKIDQICLKHVMQGRSSMLLVPTSEVEELCLSFNQLNLQRINIRDLIRLAHATDRRCFSFNQSLKGHQSDWSCHSSLDPRMEIFEGIMVSNSGLPILNPRFIVRRGYLYTYPMNRNNAIG